MAVDNLAQAEKAYQTARTSCRLILENFNRAEEEYLGLIKLYGITNPQIVTAEKRCWEMRPDVMIAIAEEERTKKEYEAALAADIQSSEQVV
jgi:hypothetical protein